MEFVKENHPELWWCVVNSSVVLWRSFVLSFPVYPLNSTLLLGRFEGT